MALHCRCTGHLDSRAVHVRTASCTCPLPPVSPVRHPLPRLPSRATWGVGPRASAVPLFLRPLPGARPGVPTGALCPRPSALSLSHALPLAPIQPLSAFVPRRAAGNPAARARRTVSCLVHGLLPSSPVPPRATRLPPALATVRRRASSPPPGPPHGRPGVQPRRHGRHLSSPATRAQRLYLGCPTRPR